MALKSDAKFEEKLTRGLRNDMRNLTNFHQSALKNLKIRTFIRSFYPKQKIYELEIYRGVMCHDNWRMMQNLKSNWLVSSKWTWGIWRILTQALENLKNLHFNGLLFTKVYNVWATKSTEELCLIILKIDAKFEGNRTCTL